jgi:hypothetical protein
MITVFVTESGDKPKDKRHKQLSNTYLKKGQTFFRTLKKHMLIHNEALLCVLYVIIDNDYQRIINIYLK